MEYYMKLFYRSSKKNVSCLKQVPTKPSFLYLKKIHNDHPRSMLHMWKGYREQMGDLLVFTPG